MSRNCSQFSPHLSQFFVRCLSLSLALLVAALLGGCQFQALKPGGASNDASNEKTQATQDTGQTSDQDAPEVIIVDNRQALKILQELHTKYWQLRQLDNPELFEPEALADDPSPNPWDSPTGAARERQALSYQNLISRLDSLDELLVSPEARLRVSILRALIDNHATQLECSSFRNPYSERQNAYQHMLRSMADFYPIRTIEEAHLYLDQMALAPAYISQWNTQIEESLANGVNPPAPSRDRVLNQLSQELARFPFSDNPQAAEIWQDFSSKLDSLTLYPKSRAIIEKKAKTLLQKELMPVMQATIQRVEQSAQLGAITGIDQASRYCYLRQLSHWSANADIHRFDRHQLAVDKVTAINTQLTGLIASTNANIGPALADWVRQHQAGQAPTQLADALEQRLANLNSEMGNIVHPLPITGLILQTQDGAPEYQSAAELSKTWTAQAIEQASGNDQHSENPQTDGLASSASGRYLISSVPSEQLPEHWRWPASAYAESLPGSHLQYSLAQENPVLPDMLKTPHIHAYNRAWPFYAAELAGRFGGYSRPEEAIWPLIWRLDAAVVLALDTGLHLGHWNADQALEYCTANSHRSRSECDQLLTQISADPGTLARLGLELDALDRLLTALGKATDSRLDPPVSVTSDSQTNGAQTNETQTNGAQTNGAQATNDRVNNTPASSSQPAVAGNAGEGVTGLHSFPILEPDRSKLADFHGEFLAMGALPPPVWQSWLAYWLLAEREALYQRSNSPTSQ